MTQHRVMVRGEVWRKPAWMQGFSYLWLGSLVAAGFAAATPVLADSKEYSSHVQISPDPKHIPDFVLTGLDAKPVRFSDLRGGTVLVFFGFTHCQSVCPPTMQALRLVTRSLVPEDDPLTTVLVSVDGERDTPEAMKSYLEPFQPGFVGMTGDPRLVRDVAATFSAVFFKGLPRDRSGAYDVEHSSQIYVVDAEGRLRAIFYGAPVGEMVAVIRQLRSAG